MGIAVLFFMSIVAVWAAWTAYEVNKAGGYPPYQDNTMRCKQDCRQGRECDCYQRSCDMTVKEYKEATAAWPFPVEKK